MSSTLLLNYVVRERAEDSCDSKAGVPKSNVREPQPQERSGQRAWQETLTDWGQRRVGSGSGPGDPGSGRDSARTSLQPSLFPTLPLATLHPQIPAPEGTRTLQGHSSVYEPVTRKTQLGLSALLTPRGLVSLRLRCVLRMEPFSASPPRCSPGGKERWA